MWAIIIYIYIYLYIFQESIINEEESVNLLKKVPKSWISCNAKIRVTFSM